MAEVALGLVGAAATVGGASLATGSGFVGRHESSHRQEILETERNTRLFEENLDRAGDDVTQDEVSQFRQTRDEALSNANRYYDSIIDYKDTSWFNLPKKLKKKDTVRKWKNRTRQSNHSMRNINESVCSGSDTSSIAASSGSPPRSNLARYDIGDWAQGVGPPDEEQWSYYSPSEHPRTESFTPDEHNLSSARYSASASSISLHTPAILATNTPANIPARPTRHPRMDNHPASPYSSSGFGYSAPTDPALDFSGLIPMYDTTARYPRYSPHSSASESPPLTYFPNPHHHVQQHHHHPYLPRPQPSTSRSNGGGGGATSTPSDGTTKKSCSHCHVTTTPLRRREPTTNRPLCNACWLYLQLRNRLPPQELIDADNDDAEEEGPQISDADYTGPKCTHCGTRQTSVWRRDKEGLQLCNACGVYERLRGKKRPLSSRRKKGVPRSERGADGRGVRYKPYAGAGVKLPPLNAQLPSATSSEKPNIAGEDTV